MRRAALLTVLLAALAASFALPRVVAETDSATYTAGSLPLRVISDVTTSSVTVDDGTAGLTGKRSAVLEWEVNGQTVKVLLRVQEAPNGVWVDLIARKDHSTLDTAVGAMDLSSEQANHPSPTEDQADTDVLAATAP